MSKPLALLTNDDGIDSWFLRVMVEAMVEAFDVVVAAPMGEQSWIGHAMSRRREVHMAEFHDFPCKAYALDGTPADCTNIALGNLVDRTPDIVCSGINLGYNVCLPLIACSGTIGGALQGALWGIPAVAYSHVIAQEDYEPARENHGKVEGPLAESLRNAAEITREFALSVVGSEPASPIVHNINFPEYTKTDTEIVRAEPAPMRMQSFFEKKTEASFRFGKVERYPIAQGGINDMQVLNEGKISHTILDLGEIGKVRD